MAEHRPRRRRRWPGWAKAVDEELLAAGGSLPWRQLQAAVVARFKAAADEPQAESSAKRRKSGPGVDPALLALTSVPEHYLSREDAVVRLPPTRYASATAAAAAAVVAWPGWRSACDKALTDAGGSMPWPELVEVLVASYRSSRPVSGVSRAAAGAVEEASSEVLKDEVVRVCALASVPEQYLSRADRYVRLRLVAGVNGAGAPVRCEGGRCFLAAAPKEGTTPPAEVAEAGSAAAAPPAARDDPALSSAVGAASAGGSGAVAICEDEASFRTALAGAGGDLLVVDFTAEWCGACQRIKPELWELAQEMPEVHFLEVDVDSNAVVANRFRITSMPTFLFFKSSKFLGEYKGANIDELTIQIVNWK